MNNTELQKLFQSIMLENDNIFDVYIKLKDYNKDYKTTSFYNSTKFTIYQAFDLYMKGIGQIDYIISLFKNADEMAILDVFDRISNSLNLDSVMDQMTSENKELLNNLLPFINQ